MYLPEGYTEDQVLSCINYICDALAKQFIFGYYGLEDVKQEIRIFCLEALPKYDASRGKLSTFLMMVCKSRLVNFRRNMLYRMPPTCNCEKCLSGIECDYIKKRMDKWKKINTSKRNLMNVNNIGDDDYEDYTELSFCNTNDRREMVEIIDEYLDVNLRADYRRMVEGASLPKKRKDKVMTEIRNILKNLKYGDD